MSNFVRLAMLPQLREDERDTRFFVRASGSYLCSVDEFIGTTEQIFRELCIASMLFRAYRIKSTIEDGDENPRRFIVPVSEGQTLIYSELQSRLDEKLRIADIDSSDFKPYVACDKRDTSTGRAVLCSFWGAAIYDGGTGQFHVNKWLPFKGSNG